METKPPVSPSHWHFKLVPLPCILRYKILLRTCLDIGGELLALLQLQNSLRRPGDPPACHTLLLDSDYIQVANYSHCLNIITLIVFFFFFPVMTFG